MKQDLIQLIGNPNLFLRVKLSFQVGVNQTDELPYYHYDLNQWTVLLKEV